MDSHGSQGRHAQALQTQWISQTSREVSESRQQNLCYVGDRFEISGFYPRTMLPSSSGGGASLGYLPAATTLAIHCGELSGPNSETLLPKSNVQRVCLINRYEQRTLAGSCGKRRAKRAQISLTNLGHQRLVWKHHSGRAASSVGLSGAVSGRSKNQTPYQKSPIRRSSELLPDAKPTPEARSSRFPSDLSE